MGRTGSPQNPAGSTRTILAAIDRMTDRTLANQAVAGGATGYWNYTSPGDDSSTTQYAGAGLAAARGYYIFAGDPGNRIPLIATALARTSDAYAANAKVNVRLEGDVDHRRQLPLRHGRRRGLDPLSRESARLGLEATRRVDACGCPPTWRSRRSRSSAT